MAAMDRISELPEPILRHILSFLSQKEAIQTSFLSRKWRHVGPTLPKIELRERWFQNSGDASFLSVLRRTLRRYYYRKLPVYEFILEIALLPKSESKSKSKSDHRPPIDSEFTNSKTLFKGLKRLSLIYIKDGSYWRTIKDEVSWEKIIRSCPSIEYLLVSGYVGSTTIPLDIFQADFLAELHLIRCILTVTTTDQLLLNERLKTLSLEKVNITEAILEKIMCGCPLIESLLLKDCKGLENIQLIKNNNNNLKHFRGSFYQVKTQSIEIDAPTIETIRIEDCRNWYCHHKYYFFPHLKSLYLLKVNLSAEFFQSLSSDFPSLEELKLVYCYLLPEIQLTVCSIKRLVLIVDSEKLIKATIYAPNIQYFKFSGPYLPKLIFLHSDATREWKSDVIILDGNKAVNLPWWLRELSKLLNSLRESQISLKFYYNPLKYLKLEDAVFCKLVPLESVSVEGGYKPCSFPDLFNCLYLICRPRYIFITPITDLKKEKDKLAEIMTFKTIGNEGEMISGYLWVRDLEEISMQVWDDNSRGWHTVEGTCFPGFKTFYPRIRFYVKWRDN